MEERAHTGFSIAIKVMAFLPLLLMGVGVWYYLSRQSAEETSLPPAAVSVVNAPAAGRAALPPGAEMPSLNLEIKGSPEFVSQVTQALKLVWTADRDTFLFLKNSLYIIGNEDKTDFYLDAGRPVAAISNDHAFRSHTWCAGIIAHQAWHAWYTLKGAKKGRKAPPQPGQKPELNIDMNPMKFEYKDLDSILDMENRASAFQLDVLKKIRAPAAERNLVFRRDSRDFTTGHDGNYALKP